MTGGEFEKRLKEMEEETLHHSVTCYGHIQAGSMMRMVDEARREFPAWFITAVHADGNPAYPEVWTWFRRWFVSD